MSDLVTWLAWNMPAWPEGAAVCVSYTEPFEENHYFRKRADLDLSRFHSCGQEEWAAARESLCLPIPAASGPARRPDVTPWHPSVRAVNRVKDPLPTPKECRLCGCEVRLRSNAAVYGQEIGDWPWIYQCEGCQARVGIHPGTPIPLGALADEKTREARKDAKRAFMRLVRSPGLGMSRSRAYSELAEELGQEVRRTHFGWFDIEECARAKRACERIYDRARKARDK